MNIQIVDNAIEKTIPQPAVVERITKDQLIAQIQQWQNSQESCDAQKIELQTLIDGYQALLKQYGDELKTQAELDAEEAKKTEDDAAILQAEQDAQNNQGE